MKRYAVILIIIFIFSLIPNTSIISETKFENLDDAIIGTHTQGRSNNLPTITSFNLNTTGDLIVGQEESLQMYVEAFDADDPSGESLEYEWSYQSGDLPCGGTADAGTTCEFPILNAYVTVFAVTVTVTDSEDASVSEEMMLEIWNNAVGSATTASGIEVQYTMQYFSPGDFTITAADGDLTSFENQELPGYTGTYDAIGVVAYAPDYSYAADDILTQSMTVIFEKSLGATSLWYVTDSGLWQSMSTTVEEVDGTTSMFQVTLPDNTPVLPAGSLVLFDAALEEEEEEEAIPVASISAFYAYAGQGGALVMNWDVSSVLLSSDLEVVTISCNNENGTQDDCDDTFFPFTTNAVLGAQTYTLSGANTAHGVTYYVSVAICNAAGCSTPYGSGSIVADKDMRGMPAPNLVGKAYNGSGWQDFDLQTYFNTYMGGASEWVMIEFMDTDCPYCFNTAQEYQEASNYFAAENFDWHGPQVSFLASATELTGLQGHDSSRSEIEAFRDKTEGEMCNSSNVDCSTRNGQAFAIPFIDDLNKTHMDKWGIGGTPSYVLIQPNCIIAWASFDHPEEKFYDAINRLVPNGVNNEPLRMPQVDSDGDGIPDCTDSFPNDANETQDSDGDGVGDNSDAFPNDGNETHDDDDDGVGNNADAFPQDENETHDDDNDGVGNNTDAFPQDGNETHDDDNDGVGNNTDAFPQDANETMDTDQDGVGDNEDPEPENPDVRTPQDISVEISDTSSYLIAGSIMFLALVILFVRRQQPPNTIAKSHFVEDESIWNDS
jgi:hypothetical protein